jgi:trigger factor
MKVTQEKLPASQIGLEIEITPEMSKAAYEKVIQEFTRSMNIPGFRKGKVPRQVLMQQFGVTRIKAKAVEDLIDSSLKKALEQEKIEALGNFQLRSGFEELVGKFEPGSALTFLAAVDVSPEVTLEAYQGFTLQAEEVKPDLTQVDKTIEGYRSQMATLIPVEGRSAQMGDNAVIDYKGMFIPAGEDAEPQEVPGGQAEDFQVDMEEGKFIPGFLEGIVGMNPDETKEVSVDFPADYPNETLAGCAATFTITLKELKEKELPELDDDFAKEVSNEQFQTLAELRESMEKRIQEEANQKTKANKEEAILTELLTHVVVELPETLIEREVTYMVTQTAMQLEQQGIDIRKLLNQDTIPILKERSRPDAIDRLKRTLALGEVAKLESLEVDPAAVTARVQELLASMEDISNVDPERARSVVAEDLVKEKILTWLEEHSTIELVPEGTLKQPAAEAALVEALAEAEAQAAEITAADTTVEVVAETVVDSEPAAEVEPVAEAESVAEAEPAAEAEPKAESEKPKKSKGKK